MLKLKNNASYLSKHSSFFNHPKICTHISEPNWNYFELYNWVKKIYKSNSFVLQNILFTPFLLSLSISLFIKYLSVSLFHFKLFILFFSNFYDASYPDEEKSCLTRNHFFRQKSDSKEVLKLTNFKGKMWKLAAQISVWLS